MGPLHRLEQQQTHHRQEEESGKGLGNPEEGCRELDEIAQPLAAARRAQPFQLLLALHPLGHRIHAQGARQRGDRAHDGLAVVARFQIGDEALVDFAKKYENNEIKQSQIILSDQIRNSYKDRINHNVIKSFNIAIKNITEFHDKQLPKNYEINNDGLITGTMWKPIDAVGLYVPGGISVYPSSLLMNVIPALVAGVNRIVITTPCKNGNFDPYLLALIDIFNIKEVYQIGGAQAIAALAYGTQTIKPVNKIFGPGNAYVTSAKKQVFGSVGIDLIAGPSEIVVVADQNNNPQWVASDLIAQAEHDEKSQCILITDNENFALRVKEKIQSLSSKLLNKKIINRSLDTYGAILILDNLDKAANIININRILCKCLRHESGFEAEAPQM